LAADDEDYSPGTSTKRIIYTPGQCVEENEKKDRKAIQRYWVGVLDNFNETDREQTIKLHSPKLISATIGGCISRSCCTDTGSAADLISAKFLRDSGLNYQKLGKYRGPNLTSVEGTKVKLSIVVRVEVEIGGAITHTNFIVTENLLFDVLLGTPFLEDNMAIMDLGHQLMTINNSIPIPFMKINRKEVNTILNSCLSDQISRAVTASRITLKPRSTTPVKVIVRGKHEVDEQGFIEPISASEKSHKRILMPAASLVDIDKNNTCVISIVNLSFKKVTLGENTLLGRYRCTNDDEVNTELIEVGDESVFGEKSGSGQDKQDKDEDVIVTCEDSSCNVCMCVHSLVPTQDEKEKMMEVDEAKGEEFNISSKLTDKQKQSIKELLMKYKELWEKTTHEIEHIPGAEHRIIVNDETTPIRSKLRPTTAVEDSIVGEHVEIMLERKVIRQSTSPWASLVLLADKKNGKVRFCVDYRRLNKVTRKDAYPLPNIKKILDKLGGKKFFSTIDLRDAFWQIWMHEEDIEKTAFITHKGLFEFISMPFGLTNAPATQQRWIEKVLLGLNWQICMAYIDDIVVFSDTFEKHLEDIETLFERLLTNGMKLALEKCQFCKPSFEILGHICSEEGTAPNPSKIEVIQNFPLPSMKDELARFLGMISWVRRFIPNCSKLTAPLRELSKQTKRELTKSEWTEKRMKAFMKLKDVLTSAPILIYPDMTKEFYLHVDASKWGLGAVLTQMDDKGRYRVVEYASTSLNKAQSDYPATVRECLAILWAINHFRQYIFGREFTLFTDHKALAPALVEGLMARSMLRDWTARIAEYNPKIIHKPGRFMLIPDALSRIHYAVYTEEELIGDRSSHIILPPMTEYDRERLVTGSLLLEVDTYASLVGIPKDHMDRNQITPIPEIRTFPHIMGEMEIDSISMPSRVSIPCITKDKLKDLLQKAHEISAPLTFQDEDIEQDDLMDCDEDNSDGTSIPSTPPLLWEEISEGRSWPGMTVKGGTGESEVDPEEQVTINPNSFNQDLSISNLEDFRRLQRTDPLIKAMIDYKLDGTLPSGLIDPVKILKTQHCYELDDTGLLRRIDVPLKEAVKPPMVLPTVLRELFVKWFHDDPMSGHLGFAKTYAHIRERYWFPLMHQHISNYCLTCQKCQVRNPYANKHAPKAPIIPMMSNRPMAQIHVDTTKGSTKTKRGNTHIVTFVDHFTGFVKAYAISEVNARTVAQLIIKYICDFGTPTTFYMDNGTEYYKEVEALVPKLLGSDIHRISPYNPQANAKVERWH
jgi:hypothetical protein